MPWLAATLEVDAARAEALSEALLEAGASAVTLDDVEGPRHKLQVLLPLEADARSIVAQATAAAGLEAAPALEVARIEDEDWVRRSQAQFEPVRIGARLWVGPTWSTPAPDATAVVRLDPGLAFGPGSHPATKLVLAFLERSVRGGERVLDYGCGSGILGIAAAKLGASRVDAVDIDPDAVRTAAANAAANGVELRCASPEELAPGQYEIVVSNILAQPLIVLAPLLASRTVRGGRLALAGILASQAREVAGAYAPFFEMRAIDEEAGWTLVEGVRS